MSIVTTLFSHSDISLSRVSLSMGSIRFAIGLNIGIVESLRLIVPKAVLVFPQISVAVNVTVTLPQPSFGSSRLEKLLVTTTSG